MIQVYYKEHQGCRHYTLVFRRVRGLLNGKGLQIYDLTGGTDRVLKKIEDLSVAYARYCQIHDFPVGDWTLGHTVKMEDAPKSVRDMAVAFEKAGLSFMRNLRRNDNLRRDFWKYEMFNGD